MATANGHVHSAMDPVFPEAHKTLKDADPEVFGIIEDEKARQWWVNAGKPALDEPSFSVLGSNWFFWTTLASAPQRSCDVWLRAVIRSRPFECVLRVGPTWSHF